MITLPSPTLRLLAFCRQCNLVIFIRVTSPALIRPSKYMHLFMVLFINNMLSSILVSVAKTVI